MMVIPEYLIYDEMREREQRERDGGLVPLYLPLYQPELQEPDHYEDDAPSDEERRGVIIIDMNSGVVIDE